MDVQIHPCWKNILSDQFEMPYFKNIRKTLLNDKKEGITIYPKGKDIFRAYNSTPFNKVKIVLLGQDPYHGPGQAHGLSFSVPHGVAIPPSLKNIYRELSDDLAISVPQHGNLQSWADQGVLLLNAFLTVQAGQPGSHREIGWEQFTDTTITQLSKHREHLVFLLWGSFAQKKAKLIDTNKHLILQSPHPSPLSAYRGFFGNKHFSKANEYLKQHAIDGINWASLSTC